MTFSIFWHHQNSKRKQKHSIGGYLCGGRNVFASHLKGCLREKEKEKALDQWPHSTKKNSHVVEFEVKMAKKPIYETPFRGQNGMDGLLRKMI